MSSFYDDGDFCSTRDDVEAILTQIWPQLPTPNGAAVDRTWFPLSEPPDPDPCPASGGLAGD